MLTANSSSCGELRCLGYVKDHLLLTLLASVVHVLRCAAFENNQNSNTDSSMRFVTFQTSTNAKVITAAVLSDATILLVATDVCATPGTHWTMTTGRAAVDI